MLKKKIKKYIERWVPILDLQGWSIKILWDETDNVATAEAWPQYKSLALRFNLPRIKKEGFDNPRDLEDLVLHELVHGPLWTLARGLERLHPEPVTNRFEEECTTTITTALLRARNMGKKRRRRRY